MTEKHESDRDKEFMRRHGFHVAGKSCLSKERKTNRRRRREHNQEMTFSEKLEYFEFLNNEDDDQC